MRRRYVLTTLLVVLTSGLVSATGPAVAQSEQVSKEELRTLKSDLEKIRTELDEVKKELHSIREFLQRAAQPPQPQRVVATVSIAGNPIRGKNDAPVTMIEFSDYQCPFCQRFFANTLPALKKDYIDTGKVRHVFRDFPLDRIHPQARKAAEAAHCAGDQGKYWEMHDVLFQNQKDLQVDKLKSYARDLDIDAAAFDICLDKGKYSAEIQQDLDDGVKAGVRGTPAFFVGKTKPDNTVEGVLISGAHPFPVFRQEIERVLQEK